MLKLRKNRLREKLSQEWKSLFKLNFLNEQGKEAFRKLILDNQFHKLSSRDVEKATGIDHSVVCKYRKATEERNKRSERGRPKILSTDDEEHLLGEARAIRREYMPLTCKLMTQKTNSYLSTKNKHVSRFTVGRFMKRRKWRIKHSVRKQALDLRLGTPQ